MYRLNIGSSLVAASQFFPMLHIFVGTTAVSISKMVFRGTEWVDILEWQGGDMTGLAEISFATILTGIGLIIPSVVLGTIIVALLGLDKDGRRLT